MHVFQGNSGKDETTGRLLIEDARNQIRKKRPRHNYKKMPREYRRKKKVAATPTNASTMTRITKAESARQDRSTQQVAERKTREAT